MASTADVDMAPPPYVPDEKQSATFAQLATTVKELSGDQDSDLFHDVLKAFKAFLTSQEQTQLSKGQLKVLRGRVVSVIEDCARQPIGNALKVLPDITNVLNTVAQELDSKATGEKVLTDPSASKYIDDLVGQAFEEIEAKLHEVMQEKYEESTLHKEELLKAREADRQKISELETIVNQLKESHETFDQRVQELMQEKLKIIGDKGEEGPRQEDARQALAIIAGLTGKSLPPSTVLDQKFVTIGKTAINQGNSYDIFLGEYFTGEKVAIKVLRQRVSYATVQKMHERFARQTLNWASLRHDSILPFYGVGVMSSPVSEGEFQLYMVSPFLQNQDVQRYLKKYEKTSSRSRLQMTYDIARGLEYMHEESGLGQNGVVHSALNPSNILIKDSGRAVISGFGHAKILEGIQENFTGDNPGYRYMGPEMIDESILTNGSDIWAWAMTSLEILTDEPPYGKKTKGPQIIRAVGQGRKPKRGDHPKIEECIGCADALWELFQHCWELNPEDRPRASEVVSRLKPLFQQLGKKNNNNEQADPPTGQGRGPTLNETGRGDPTVQTPPQPMPGQQLGPASKPVTQVPAPTQPPRPQSQQTDPEGNQLGKVSQPVVPGPPKK